MHVHVFVALGAGNLTDVGPLSAGDAVRLTNEPSSATEPSTLTFTATADETELLIWATA